MKKFYFVAKQEYRNRTFTRSFIVGTLIIPIMIAVIIGVTILIIERSKDNRPFGYVDYSGALANTSMQKDPEDSVEIISYLDEESVRKALEAEEIQGYHLIPEDYLENLKVDLYYLEEAPTSKVLKDFDDFIRANILDTPPTPTQVRIMEGSNLTVQAINENREFQDNDSGIVMIMLPLMIAMFFCSLSWELLVISCGL